MMTLSDRLQVCLLAVESRYPHQRVRANGSIVGSFQVEGEGWSAEEMIACLEQTAPSLLMAKAVLVMDAQERSIYLPDYSTVKPAFCILSNDHKPALRTPIDQRHQPQPTHIPVG